MNNNLYTLEGILQEGLKINATDIHITTNKKLAFRVKKDIILYDKIKITKTVMSKILLSLTNTEKVEADLHRRISKDGNYVYKQKYYYRFNAARANRNIHLSIRKLIETIPKYEDIQLNQNKIQPYIKKLLNIETGLFLIVGATGSGKTTTIMTLLDTVLKKKSIHLITLEHPIEYFFQEEHYSKSVVTQRGIEQDTDSFYDGLVDAMRQDPDVIFVGEIRDQKTAEAALQASLTGHMVLATLHAKSIEETNKRMEFLLNNITNNYDFIRGIIFQKLEKNENNKIVAKRDVYVNNNEFEN